MIAKMDSENVKIVVFVPESHATHPYEEVALDVYPLENI